MLEPNDSVIRIADDDDVTLRILPPLVGPLVEYVVQVDIRKQRRNHRALRSPLLCLRPFTVFDYPCIKPFPDQSQDSRVGDPPSDHFHQVFFVDVVEKALQVQIENPVHFLPPNRYIQRVERPMLAASRTKLVRKSPKVFLINLIEDRYHSALDNLVFQRRDSQRTHFAVGLRNEDSL